MRKLPPDQTDELAARREARALRQAAERLATDAGPADRQEQLERRRIAALRLPPLACGCHDPLGADHLDSRCRYPSGRRA